MAQVKIYSETDSSKCRTVEKFTEIQNELKKINIAIERWTPKSKLSPEANQEEILEAYADQVSQVMGSYGFSSVDVISMNTAVPAERITESRKKFLDEHIHSDDEVRYFIEGQGLFCIHAGEQVIQILCEAGDFIAVPANTKHWLDMGSKPNFRCIRFFGDERGWVAEYTGDEIAEKFPLIENICRIEAR
jgi:1,2-dihydroxy-3-keto-5-methylthiopentene dioxygenase